MLALIAIAKERVESAKQKPDTTANLKFFLVNFGKFTIKNGKVNNVVKANRRILNVAGEIFWVACFIIGAFIEPNSIASTPNQKYFRFLFFIAQP